MLVKNFLFHRVSDEEDVMWPPMKPALFSRILSFLTQQYRVVPLEEFLENPGSFKTGNKAIATISFDDGYKDNIEVAAPILKKFKCPASFYIVTDCINRNIPTWTYNVGNALQQTHIELLELPYNFVPERFKSIQINNQKKSKIAVKTLKHWMKNLKNTERLLVTESIIQQCSDVSLMNNKMMSWGDIRQLSQEGFIIGSHSHTHPLLASLQDESAIAHELKTSAQRILQETGHFPQTISFPIGSFDERVTRLSKKEGYKYGLAVEQKFFTYPSDLMIIPRVEIFQQPWLKVKMFLTGNYWNRLRRLVR